VGQQHAFFLKKMVVHLIVPNAQEFTQAGAIWLSLEMARQDERHIVVAG
jgi:hypothetical protein